MPVKTEARESVQVKKTKLSSITTMHYVKLVLRSVLLILGVVLYIINKVKKLENTYLGFEQI